MHAELEALHARAGAVGFAMDAAAKGARKVRTLALSYIAAADPHLVAGDVRFEPSSALVAGADGLDDLRVIAAQAPAHLVPGGWLLLEHGYDQAAAVRALLAEQGFIEVASRTDLGGHERITLGRLPC